MCLSSGCGCVGGVGGGVWVVLGGWVVCLGQGL